jgi:ketosteroid isomerase-like protein
VTDLAAVRDWLDRYEHAWRSNDAEAIRGLFTEEATYRWNPYGRDSDAAVGREAIVAAWLDAPDDPATWQMVSEGLAVNGDLAVARCTVHYSAGAANRDSAETYHNLWVLRLTDDGRCSDFTEHYMKAPSAS